MNTVDLRLVGNLKNTVNFEMNHFEGHSESVVYLRFLNLLDAIRGDPVMPHLEAPESSLLDMLAREWFAERKVTVLAALQSDVAGMSESTIHRKLKSLRKLDLIDMVLDEHDQRIKYIQPTQKALDYFDRMGSCLLKSQLATA